MLFEDIPEADLKMIDLYRRRYSPSEKHFKEEISFCDLKDVLSVWAEQKENLYKLFGKKLRIEKEISYKKPFNVLEDEIKNLKGRAYFGRVERDANLFIHEYRTKLLTNKFPSFFYTNDEEQKRSNEIHQGLETLISNAGLAENYYDGETFFIPLENNKKLKVPNKCKIIKILGKIASAFGLEGYEDFRICHSQILNQKSLKGKLVLSIHPLDYMTMSDNNCGWESCMSWIEEGSYRQGTVEMMNSPNVVVAYLEAENSMTLVGANKEVFSWNNKKWRQLFIVDEKCIASIKGYPYENKELTILVMKWLKNLCKENLNWDFSSKLFPYHEKEFINYSLVEDPIKIIFNTEVMYNDFGTTHHYIYLKNHYDEEDFSKFSNSRGISIWYSGPSQCMACGDTYPVLMEDSDLVCDNCQDRGTACCCCEEYYSTEDGYIVDGEFVCPDCYENYVRISSLSERPCFKDDLRRVYVIPNALEDNQNLIVRNYEPDFYVDYSYDLDEFAKKFLKENASIYKCTLSRWGEEFYCVCYDELNEKGLSYSPYLTDFSTKEEYVNYWSQIEGEELYRYEKINL